LAAPAEEPADTAVPDADPNLSGSAAVAEEAPLLVSADRDPADRWGDRLLAKLGLLDDAAPLFRDGERVPRAGVLLALPAIAQSGVVDTAREIYGSIGPAFYGLRTTIVALVFMALLRIKRPEAPAVSTSRSCHLSSRTRRPTWSRAPSAATPSFSPISERSATRPATPRHATATAPCPDAAMAI
jgi:hypothetical protein